ncbi:hypothetical protein PUP68_13695 [Pseudomonas chlororaphis]|uniref:hypothetical protein n=1 Tax=Pseudomonas chlororaphis TaxID=587753 RepID=UPI00087C0D0F|nr:hypothetical protein [Pseudomonas chlororaphis]AZC30466.1 hypothetical protein C4K38_2506 [Pseudomonas chlororaphis subsp. piscium]WDG79103.1 hypothetical protein PUP77_32580 [Pseudomonas chlororaphis]WDG88116.1 hypothetical protein PUP68_13695 [Pseudomonas chlororaphis]WDG94375.1 hypothetical protein PUP49_13425 [Pseudomonas chlororaphis]SDT17130.1 hypothetical protein SAMN05216585_4865 [Pseudomonas chlororaphis]
MLLILGRIFVIGFSFSIAQFICVDSRSQSMTGQKAASTLADGQKVGDLRSHRRTPFTAQQITP